MKEFSNKTQQTIHILLEPSDLNKLVYDALKRNGYSHFEEKEIELKYDFVEEGSPSYKTGKVKCSIKIVKDLNA